MWSVNEAPPRKLHNRFRPVPADAQENKETEENQETESKAYDQLRDCLAVIRRTLWPFPAAFDAVVAALREPGPHNPQPSLVT